MTMRTEDGWPPGEYVMRRTYQIDVMNPYNGPYANRLLINAENDIMYGKIQIEAEEGNRNGKAEMHGPTDPNRGRDEAWRNKRIPTEQPMKEM